MKSAVSSSESRSTFESPSRLQPSKLQLINSKRNLKKHRTNSVLRSPNILNPVSLHPAGRDATAGTLQQAREQMHPPLAVGNFGSHPPNSKLDATFCLWQQSPLSPFLLALCTWRGKLQACSLTGVTEPGIGIVAVIFRAAPPGVVCFQR